MNRRPHKGERISTQPVNKTLSLLHSVGESATAGLLWHLCSRIPREKAVLSDHLSLGAAQFHAVAPERTVSEERVRAAEHAGVKLLPHEYEEVYVMDKSCYYLDGFIKD